MVFIGAIGEALGRRAELNLLPMQPGDVAATYADVDDLVRDVGFSPATPIQVGRPLRGASPVDGDFDRIAEVRPLTARLA